MCLMVAKLAGACGFAAETYALANGPTWCTSIRLLPSPAPRRRGAPTLPATPLVSVRGWIRDRLVGFLASFGTERAFVSTRYSDLAPEPAVLAEPCAARPRNWIVLPCTFPAERHAGLGRPRVYITEQAVHPDPIAGTREREERRPEDVEAIVHPSPGVDDAPPATVLRGDSSHCLPTIVPSSQSSQQQQSRAPA